jgi:hypothetical protein
MQCSRRMAVRKKMERKGTRRTKIPKIQQYSRSLARKRTKVFSVGELS